MPSSYRTTIAVSRPTVITATVTALLTVALALYIQRSAFFPGDLAFTHFWQSLANPALTAVMKGITFLFGDWPATILTGFVTLFFAWKIGVTEGVTVALSALFSLFNYLFKMIIDRPRPSPDLVEVMINETNFSYPSSHACFSILFLGIIIYFLYKHLQKGPLKSIALPLLGFLILVVGFTRVYLGVHWYSDMLAGYLFGGFFLSLLIMGFEYLRSRASR